MLSFAQKYKPLQQLLQRLFWRLGCASYNKIILDIKTVVHVNMIPNQMKNTPGIHMIWKFISTKNLPNYKNFIGEKNYEIKL
jgi:hypothetical protein